MTPRRDDDDDERSAQTSATTDVWIKSSVLEAAAAPSSPDANGGGGDGHAAAAKKAAAKRRAAAVARSYKKSTTPPPGGGRPSIVDPNWGREWGWVRGTMSDANGGLSPSSPRGGDDVDDEFVKIDVDDPTSKHDGSTAILPRSILLGSTSSSSPGGSKPGVVTANPPSVESDPPSDLVDLPHLHEPALVTALQSRYDDGIIYTATGPNVLLALNPFRNLGASTYGDAVMAKYWSIAGTEKNPHVYKTADDAYRSMIRGMYRRDTAAAGLGIVGVAGASSDPDVAPGDDAVERPGEGGGGTKKKVHQSLLVGGESGAGKTLTVWHALRYLATLSRRGDLARAARARNNLRASNVAAAAKRGPILSSTSPSSSPIPKPKFISRNTSRDVSVKADAKIEERILESYPILEAFGNARTVRNDNSSRFGKYIELSFDRAGTLTSGRIDTYLLEKVRLVSVEKEERTFHVYYELLAGATDEEREYCRLGKMGVEDFKMTSMSGTFGRRDGVDDKGLFDALMESMRTMGFGPSRIQAIPTIVAACLHLSNLTFLSSHDDESSQIDMTNRHLSPALALLGLDLNDFNEALTSYEVTVGKDAYRKALPIDKAEKGLEALIKALHGAMFGYVVDRINDSIARRRRPYRRDRDKEEEEKEKDDAPTGRGGGAAFIGVLDIFGFESFECNSFEQLCINYANEALQQQFNAAVFRAEQDIYESEGIEWSPMLFRDNRDALDLIDGKGIGIFPILDDMCKAPRATDKTFSDSLYERFRSKPHARFEADHLHKGRQQFLLRHYAGPVEYDVRGFVTKNRDEMPRGTISLLRTSSKEFVGELADAMSPPGAAASPDGSDGGSANTSRTKMTAAKRKSTVTVASQFASQLRDLRKRIDETVPHYVRCVKPNPILRPHDFRRGMVSDQLRCLGVLEAVMLSRAGYPHRLGRRLFVERYGLVAPGMVWADRTEDDVTDVCDALLAEISKKFPGVLKLGSGDVQLGRTKVFLRKRAFDTLEQLRNRTMHAAAVMIQSVVRCYCVQEAVMRAWFGALEIQTCWRCYLEHKTFSTKKREAVRMQRLVRGWRARARCTAMREEKKRERETAAIVVQRSVRGCSARAHCAVLREKHREREAAEAAAKAAVEEEERLLAAMEAAKRHRAAEVQEEIAIEEERCRRVREEIEAIERKLAATVDAKVEDEARRTTKRTEAAEATEQNHMEEGTTFETATMPVAGIEQLVAPSSIAAVNDNSEDEDSTGPSLRGGALPLESIPSERTLPSALPSARSDSREIPSVVQTEETTPVTDNSEDEDATGPSLREDALPLAPIPSERTLSSVEPSTVSEALPWVQLDSPQIPPVVQTETISSEPLGDDERRRSRQRGLLEAVAWARRNKLEQQSQRRSKRSITSKTKHMHDSGSTLSEPEEQPGPGRMASMRKKAAQSVRFQWKRMSLTSPKQAAAASTRKVVPAIAMGDGKQADLEHTLKLAAGLPPLPTGAYDVVLPITSVGLMLNITEVQGTAAFAGYRPFPDGSQGPAQSANLIHGPGDKMLAINGIPLRYTKFGEVISLLIKATARDYCHLRFQEWRHAYVPTYELIKVAPKNYVKHPDKFRIKNV